MSIQSNNANHSSSRIHIPSYAETHSRPSERDSSRLHPPRLRWDRSRQIVPDHEPWTSRQGSVFTSGTDTRKALRVHSISLDTEPLQIAYVRHEEQYASCRVPSSPGPSSVPQTHFPAWTQHDPQERSMGPSSFLKSFPPQVERLPSVVIFKSHSFINET